MSEEDFHKPGAKYSHLKEDVNLKKIDKALDKPRDQALREIESVIISELNNIIKAHAYVHKGVVFCRKDGDTEQAKKWWQEAKDLNSGDTDAVANLGGSCP